GHARGVRRLGVRANAGASARDVRARRVGCRRAHASPRPRPAGRKAALLWLGRLVARDRLGAEGLASVPGLRAAREPRGARAVRALWLRAFALEHLRGRAQAAARMLDGDRTGECGREAASGAAALLVPRRGREPRTQGPVPPIRARGG